MLAQLGALLLLALPTAAQAQATSSPYTSATRYDADGRVTGTIAPDPDGAGPLTFLAVRTTYDTGGRPVKVEQGALAGWQSEAVAPAAWSGFTVSGSVETTYDALDRKLTETQKGSDGVAFALTQYSYDAAGRLECSALRMNPAAWSALPTSACTQGTGAGDYGPDRITRVVYDPAGQVLQRRVAVGTADEAADATYEYTLNGKRKTIVDANGNRAELRYDGFDRQVAWVFPSSGAPPAAYNDSTPANALASAGSVAACNIGTVTETGGIAGPSETRNAGDDCEKYSSDRNGNRAKLIKRDGGVLAYEYDALNRNTKKTVPERAGLASTHTRDVYYAYDLTGLQTSARFDSASGEGIANAYDGFGRLTSTTQALDGVSRTLGYQYDANGNRVRVTHPDGNYVQYDYDELDRPVNILRNASALEATYKYQADGKLYRLSASYPAFYAYEPSGRLASINHSTWNTTYVNQFGFGYTPAGQIAQLTKSNDLYAWTGSVNVDRNYTANGLNQYGSVGGATFGYDLNGNLTSDGSSTFGYDVENRLVTKSGGAVLRYDPLGRLYEVGGSVGTTRFLYDGDALVAEYGAAGSLLRRYVHGSDAKADDPIAWYEGSAMDDASERLLHADWEGSVISATDRLGTTIHSLNRYDEYGIPFCPIVGGAQQCPLGAGQWSDGLEANKGRFGYTGQIWIGELGLWHYKARAYSPRLGRFMQTDPIGYEGGMNLQGYVGADPGNKVDFSGTEDESIKEIVVTAKKAATAVSESSYGRWLRIVNRPIVRTVKVIYNNSAWTKLYGLPDSQIRDINNPDSLDGATPEEVAEAALARGYKERPGGSARGDGRVFEKGNGSDIVRIMPGNPARSTSLERGPYAAISRHGTKTKVPLAGNNLAKR